MILLTIDEGAIKYYEKKDDNTIDMHDLNAVLELIKFRQTFHLKI